MMAVIQIMGIFYKEKGAKSKERKEAISGHLRLIFNYLK